MRFNRKERPSQAIIVQMAEEEDDGTDENERPASPTETVVAAGGVKIMLTEGTVKAGCWVKGRVVIDHGSPQISNLTVTLSGIGLAHFASDDGKEYKAKQEFLSETIDLGHDFSTTQPENANKEINVPFQYRIPIEAPPSFVGNHGGINYECVAILRFTSALVRRRIRRVKFQVTPRRSNGGSVPPSPMIESKAINDPISIQPQLGSSGRSISFTHRLTSFGFFDGLVDIRLQTDETNLKRGRTEINVILEVNNKTNLHLRDLRFGILLTTEWNAKGRRITERSYVAEEKREDFCLRPSKEIRLEKVFLAIPINLPPTVEFSVGCESGGGKNEINVTNPVCRCIYTVFAKLVPPNFSKTCLVELPLNVY